MNDYPRDSSGALTFLAGVILGIALTIFLDRLLRIGLLTFMDRIA